MNYLTTDTELTSIASAIRSKTGRSVDIEYPTEYASEIGRLEPVEKTVRFMDYDGTILYSYTPEAFLDLSAMPPNPSHTGLTAQGWNWTFSDAQEYVEKYGQLDIGQNYNTSDGKTRLYIHIPAEFDLYLNYYQSDYGGVVIDWGDESEPDSEDGEIGETYYDHVYDEAGDYVVTLTIVSGTAKIGWGDDDVLYGDGEVLKKVELGSGMGLNGIVFKNYYALDTITIPQGLTEINEDAFNECVALRELILPNGITALGENAFYECRNLRVSFPKSLETIGEDCFFESGIDNLTLPENITLNENAFYRCRLLNKLVIPEGVHFVGWNHFGECSAIKSAYLCDTVDLGTEDNGGIFYDCYTLENVRLPNDMTLLQSDTFMDNYALRQITIPDSVTSIDESAFYACWGLESIILSEIESIPRNCFEYCYKLREITIPDSVTSIEEEAFLHCENLRNVTMSSNVESIGEAAFRYCYNLESVYIPDGATMDLDCFRQCYNLSSVRLPSDLATIPNRAFYMCYQLGEITIPNTVTTIAPYAFGYSGIRTIHMRPTTPPTLGANAFLDVDSNYVVYVPSASLNAYQTASGWSSIASHIQAEP